MEAHTSKTKKTAAFEQKLSQNALMTSKMKLLKYQKPPVANKAETLLDPLADGVQHQSPLHLFRLFPIKEDAHFHPSG